MKSEERKKKEKEFGKEIFSKVSQNLLEQHREFSGRQCSSVYPDIDNIVNVLKKIKAVIFPGYFCELSESESLASWIQSLLEEIYSGLQAEIKTALLGCKTEEEASELAGEISIKLINQLDNLQQLLYKDAEASFNGDPAAQGVDEIILTYPGFYAVFIHRIAHFLFSERIPYIPRIMSEYAHNITGIDIHPGAVIGEYFFIDHGTGVVIGETAIIGNHVKLYQGVTLGALSTKSGHKLAGKKRHPTIEDNVTIYSGASILGGETIVGKNSTIGGNMFIVKSVPKNTTVRGIKQEE